MGNSYNCQPFQYFKMISLNVCFKEPPVEKDKEQIIIDLDNQNNNNNKLGTKINDLKIYFNEVENELMHYNNLHKSKKITKKHLSKKKHINALNKLSDNKYELMLKRLLEQKKIKRNGPKRRETIRKDIAIKQVVNEVISGNVQNEKINIKKNEKENDLLIKNINDQKYRCSATIDRNDLMVNNLIQNQKKFNYKFYQYRNTINDIINESSGYSGLCQKQTKQSNSPKKKEIDNI
jgi:hypothetical protein